MAKSNEIWLAAYGDLMRPSKRKDPAPDQNYQLTEDLPSLKVDDSGLPDSPISADSPDSSVNAEAAIHEDPTITGDLPPVVVSSTVVDSADLESSPNAGPASDPKKTTTNINPIGDLFALYLQEVQTYGSNPDVGAYKLMRENRVLAFCQSNAMVNSFREYGARLMAGLAKRGATHLIIDMPKSAQEALNHFVQTKDSDLLRPNLTQLKMLIPDDFLQLLIEAGKNDIKLIALDSSESTEKNPVKFALATILEVLQQENARVTFWAGNEYLEKHAGEPNLIDHLRGAGIKAATINGVVIAAEYKSRIYPLTELIPMLDDARLVETSKTAEIARCIYNAGSQNYGCVWGNFDFIYVSGRKDMLSIRNRR